MEPVKEKIGHCYTFMTTCVGLEERLDRVYDGGVGDKAVFSKVSRGWYATFADSKESLYFGTEKPWFNVGDRIKVSFQRQEK